ncbi:unnamed protein product [Peronospora belbahrii]|uniref:Uncharacterized protein n=1 Tax=Peronospora belbahrii TaxID=622444 RepID=A0AAU9KYZ1_9STRA|nr:unnamed protein product [Peronospora belbahrii]
MHIDKNSTTYDNDTTTALVLSLSSGDSINQQITTLEHAIAHTIIPSKTLQHRRRRRSRRLSKNCRTLKKFGPMHSSFRRIQNLKIDVNQTKRRRESLATQEVHLMHQQIRALERRQTLLSALHLARRTNNLQIASNKSSAFCNLDAFLMQWHNYTRYHAEFKLCCEQIQPLESEDPDVYLIQCVGHSTLRISRDTVRYFFQPLLADEEMVQCLIGKTYSFPFASRFYFNSTGQVFKMDPRAELASGLLNLVVDPFMTVRILAASQLSADGCLHAYAKNDGTVGSAMSSM